jgi:dienelactone hydrolase
MDRWQELRRQLERAREDAGRGLCFMMLDHVDHLLITRKPLPRIRLEGTKRATVVRALRRKLLQSLGLSPFPPRSPLRARCVGRVQRQGYTVDKVIFHPRAGFTVPGHLYLPTDVPRPLPGVLYASGHFVEHGIMYPDSQLCCMALTRLGFAVFAYEAIGQGERGPHWEEFGQKQLPALVNSERIQAFLEQIGDEGTGRRWLAWAWHALQGEHGQLPPRLVGLSQEGLMVWESIRALDYMCSREEIDATRLGMVGASGGGQNAYYTAALDERVRAAVSVCCLPSLVDQIRLSRGTNWWGGGDCCDQIPSHLTYAEFADVGALVLPRPLLFVLGQQDDGFPIDAARDEYSRLASFYDPLAPGCLRLAEVGGPHGISTPMREAVSGWFARWLQGRGDGSSISEPALSPEPPDSAEMRCFPDEGSVSSRPALLRLTDHLASRRAAGRRREERETGQTCPRRDLLDQIRYVLGPESSGEPHTERIVRVTGSGMEGELITLKMDGDVRVFVSGIRAAGSRGGQPLILIVHDGDWGSMWDDGWIEMLSARECDVAVLDLRGLGPDRLRTSRPPDTLQALEEIVLHQDHGGRAFVTDFEISSAYLILGRTLLGERVWDLRRCVDSFRSGESGSTGIKCLGIGHGGLVALFAAALDSRIEGVATWGAPASFRSLIMEDPVYPPSVFLFDVLRRFDLPELTAAIAPRSTIIANACDGRGQALSDEQVLEAYQCAREAYCRLGMPELFHILAGASAENRSKVCDWLAVR